MRIKSKIEKKKIKTKIVSLNDMLTFAIHNLFPRFIGKIINIEIKYFERKILVEAGNFLVEAFKIILSNRIMLNDKKKVEIIVNVSQIKKKDGKFVRVEFTDNGNSIQDDHKKDIFYKDYKKDKSNGGIDFGISLVKKIIESYGGKIWVENHFLGNDSKGNTNIILLKEA
jgi:K+-sensing histidine kinase KdpD